jgi:formylglycine-generating enzyme required for sulfatase activity
VVLSFFVIPVSVQAQTPPALTVAPYTSVRGGDEETLVVLLANHENIRSAFRVIPPAGTFSRIMEDLQGNPSGNTGPAKFNADFVIAVHTKKIRNTNLALISLVHTESLRLLAGYYLEYHAVRELRVLMPDIVKKLIAGITADQNAPKLAVMPPYTSLSKEEADLLSEALTIELANSGKYALFPWDLSRIPEPQIPYSGIIDPLIIRDLGERTGSQYILTGDLLNLGTTNLFRTGIVQTEEGSFVGEGDIEYRYIPEELGLIPQLASQLLNIKEEDIALSGEVFTPPEELVWKTPAAEPEPQPQSAGGEGLKNFVFIEAGTFVMGSPPSETSRDRDEVQHQTRVDPFYIGTYEVTQEEYRAVMGTNPSYFKGPNLPVEQVSWFDAVVYCNARSIKEGLTPVYTIREDEIIWNHSADGYRLPTEAEWEYVCRAGTATAFNLGNTIDPNQVNYDGNYPYNKGPRGTYRQKTTPVGAFAPNPWGVYDMHGNVYEWCWDQYKPYGEGGLNGSMLADAVLRGGSWFSEARFLRSANRVRSAHDARSYYIGFRVARSVLETPGY